MKRKGLGVDLVAFVLALALAFTLILVTVTALVNVVQSPKSLFSLGENTTQVLTTVLGGIIGLLGSYMGYRLHGAENAVEREEPWPNFPEPPPPHKALPSWPDRDKTVELPPEEKP